MTTKTIPQRAQRSTRSIGSRGEDLAVSFLEREGYRILKRGYRTRYGEIDIIAADGEIIAFVEVKMRRGERFGSPSEAIDGRKQRQIARIARQFIASRRCEEKVFRFDSVLIVDRLNGTMTFELIKDAFRADFM